MSHGRVEWHAFGYGTKHVIFNDGPPTRLIGNAWECSGMIERKKGERGWQKVASKIKSGGAHLKIRLERTQPKG